MNDTQTVWEVVDLADITVRAASQLRQKRSGHDISDRVSLERVAEFLERAERGGLFLSGSATAGSFDDTLRPLNWATDTYVAKVSSAGKSPDYAEVAKYLDRIKDSILHLLSGEAVADKQLEESIQFVEHLASILAANADLRLQKESRPAEYESWTV